MGCFREETEKTQVTFNGNGILAGIQVSSIQALLDWCIACLQDETVALCSNGILAVDAARCTTMPHLHHVMETPAVALQLISNAHDNAAVVFL